MAKKFKVGDIVIAVKPVAGLRYLVGRTGKVIHCDGNSIGVAFDDKFVDGHNCDGLCEFGYGRWSYGDEFELLIEDDSTELCESEILGDFLSTFEVKSV